MSTTPARGSIRIREALSALRALVQNPDDTSQAFRVIAALTGRSHDRLMARLRRGPGQRLLREKPSLLAALSDTERLRALPDGSFGREYLRFLDSEGITAKGLVEASLEGRNQDRGDADDEYVGDRMRDQHDLWHVLTGYRGDLFGEAALLAFSFGQTKNPGVGLISFFAFLRVGRADIRRFVFDGMRRGLTSEWLPEQPWEELLARPLDDVRRELRVGLPPDYVPYRSDQLRADRAAGLVTI